LSIHFMGMYFDSKEIANNKPNEKVLSRVREYCEGYPVEFKKNEQGRWIIEAFNEGGYNGVEIDLLDVIRKYESNKDLYDK
jgi:hypothetical protein